MTNLGLDKRRPSVTLMFMYTQIVSSWVLSGNRVHVKAKLWAGDCYFKLLPSWNTWVFFFSLYWFYLCAEKKWKLESPLCVFQFSMNWEKRQGRKRTILLKVFFLVSPILLFLIFFLRKIRQKNTHTGGKNKQMLFFYWYTPCFISTYLAVAWDLWRLPKRPTLGLGSVFDLYCPAGAVPWPGMHGHCLATWHTWCRISHMHTLAFDRVSLGHQRARTH